MGLPGMEGMIVSHVNRFNLSRPEDHQPLDPNTPPPNAHGEKLFLIKLQYGGGNFLIYDRQRTMNVFFLEGKDPIVFQKVRQEVESPRGGFAGLKMYRWAKRESDWGLSVCLDKEPRDEIKW